MNTRPVPIVLALAAAGVTCIVSIIQKVSFGLFLLRLFLSAVSFYVLGIVVGILLIEALGTGKENPEEAEEGSEPAGEEDVPETEQRGDALENVEEDVSEENAESPSEEADSEREEADEDEDDEERYFDNDEES